MSLQEISLTLDLKTPLPDDVAALIEEANRRAETFYDAGLGLRYPKYIPSDPRVVHAAIACLQSEGHLRGDVFCEWGCGFAIAAGIAALLGMRAYGIEIEDELFERASQLMEDLEIPVEILQTDYLPEGFDESEGVGGKDLITVKPYIRINASLELATGQYADKIPAFNPIKLFADAAQQETTPDTNDQFVKLEETDFVARGPYDKAGTLSLHDVKLAVAELAEFAPTQIAYTSGNSDEGDGSGDESAGLR